MKWRARSARPCETATLEMWLDVMYHSVDAVDEGFHPRHNHNPAACVFYVLFIIIGAFFVMNLFVGVTIDKFNEMKEEAASDRGEVGGSLRTSTRPTSTLPLPLRR
jgi:4-hydroxybenzoate polyprenyltransferase